jgi:hypothetical protein
MLTLHAFMVYLFLALDEFLFLLLLQHLKEEMKLSYLAQELISTDRLAPQSW